MHTSIRERSLSLLDRIPFLESIRAFTLALAIFNLAPSTHAHAGALGACCKPDGTCAVISPTDCDWFLGRYLGDGTSCDPYPCDTPFGACCLGAECVNRLEPACLELGGLFLGDETYCDAYICPGACCVGSECQVVRYVECTFQSGYYLGDGVPCEPTTCDTPNGCGESTARGERIDVTATLTGQAFVSGPRGDDCGTLLFTADGSYENGAAWEYAGVHPPFFGAFAECYAGAAEVCAAVLDFTQTGEQWDGLMDVYLWNDNSGCPGDVLCLKTGVDPGPIAFWPSASRHIVPLEGCCVPEVWWVGYWRAEPGGNATWYTTLDLNGPNVGCAKTCVVPGLGFPAGWQDVSMVWPGTRSLGIGAEVRPCGPVAVEPQSWGRIKQLYR